VFSGFGGGTRGGATFGLCVGVLINFPTRIFSNLLLDGFTHGLAWVVIGRAVAGVAYRK
jgi:hypothetical protein